MQEYKSARISMGKGTFVFFDSKAISVVIEITYCVRS